MNEQLNQFEVDHTMHQKVTLKSLMNSIDTLQISHYPTTNLK